MKYPWLDEYCCSKQGTEKDFKEEWNATRYMLKGKMFAMQGNDKSGKAIITLKDESYTLILKSLSKKNQKEITGKIA